MLSETYWNNSKNDKIRKVSTTSLNKTHVNTNEQKKIKRK